MGVSAGFFSYVVHGFRLENPDLLFFNSICGHWDWWPIIVIFYTTSLLCFHSCLFGRVSGSSLFLLQPWGCYGVVGTREKCCNYLPQAFSPHIPGWECVMGTLGCKSAKGSAEYFGSSCSLGQSGHRSSSLQQSLSDSDAMKVCCSYLL
jgi:hypothetical protein